MTTLRLSSEFCQPHHPASPVLVAQRSSHRIRPFHLHRPKTAEEAVALRLAAPGRCEYMAGGIDLIADLKTGTRVDSVIHLGALPGWTSIIDCENAIAIGAGVTHQLFAESPHIRASYPALSESWSRVANHRIRVKGTIAGNLMACNPLYDFAIAAIAAHAEVEFLDADLVRKQVPVDRLSELPPHALLTRVLLPRMPALAFALGLHSKPIVSYALSFRRKGEALVARLAVGCGYTTVAFSNVVVNDHALNREISHNIAVQLCSALPAPASDWRASSAYRSHLLKVLVRREIEQIPTAELIHADRPQHRRQWSEP